jgi:hypothetical protein
MPESVFLCLQSLSLLLFLLLLYSSSFPFLSLFTRHNTTFSISISVNNLYVCRSHIIFALNCGVEYLPYRRVNEKEVALYFLLSPSGVEEMTRKQRTFDSISSKIIPNMNTNEQEFGIRTYYKNPKLVRSIMNETVTNMHYKETEKINSKWTLPLFLSRFVRCISSSSL